MEPAKMTEEVLEKPEVVKVEDDDAAFEAGYAEVRGEEPPAPVVKVEEPVPEEPKGEVEEVKEAPAAPAAEPQPEIVAGLTREQLMDGLARAAKAEEESRKAFGKVGELQRYITEIQKNVSGAPVELTVDDFKDLAEEYPDLTEKFIKGLNGKMRMIAPASQGIDPAVIDQKVNEVEERLTRKYEQRLLTMKHPDWREVSESSEFKVWLGTADEQIRTIAATSWDASELDGVLTTFKSWRDKSKAPKQTEVAETRAARLEAAVTPTGVQSAPSGAVTDEDAFEMGYRSVRKR